MPLILDNTLEVSDFLDTTVTSTSRTVTTADSTPTGHAGVDSQHASYITLGFRNFLMVTEASFQLWGLTGNQWVKVRNSTFSGTDSFLYGPVEIYGYDRVFLQVTAFSGTSLDMVYLVHNQIPPSVREDRPEVATLNGAIPAGIPAPANFQVFVPYDGSSGMAVENDLGLNTVLTVEREDTGQDGDDSTTGFSLNTANTPVVSGFAGMVTVIATISSVELTMSDDGAGNLSGAAGTGTVTYATGAISVTFSDPPDLGTDILLTYTYDV